MTNNARPLGPFRKLVVLGESTVQGGGWLICQGERYADVLWRLLESAQEEPLAYFNAGLGASVISPSSPGYEDSVKPSAAERLDKQVLAEKPDLLVVAYGLNDMRAGMEVGEFRRELSAILDRVDAGLRPAVVLVNVYYMTTYRNFPPFDRGGVQVTLAYNHMLAQLAAERGAIYADVYSAEADCPHVVHPDTVHANKIGNLLIAHRIFEAVVRACPGIAGNMQRRDADSPWMKVVLPDMSTRVEPSGQGL